MSKKDSIHEDIKIIFRDIARETQSLREIDLEELVNEWKEIGQSLLMKTLKKPKLELDYGSLTDSPSDRDAQLKDNPSSYEIHPQNIAVLDRSMETQSNNDIYEIEVSDEEEWSSTYDSSDDASMESEDSDMLGNSDLFGEINNMKDEGECFSPTENAAAKNSCSNSSTDKEVIKKDYESAELPTWDLFKEEICTGDVELVTKCKTHCLKLEETLLLVEGNLRSLKNVQNLNDQLTQIYSDNFMLLGGPDALQHVEQRPEECNKIVCHHNKMRDVLVKLRKTFPLSEEAVDKNAEDLVDPDDSKNNSIEKRPVPNFWN